MLRAPAVALLILMGRVSDVEGLPSPPRTILEGLTEGR